MSDRERRAGVIAVLQASSTSLATLVFLPGMMVRIGCQMLAASASGMRISHRSFVTELGGEVEHVSGPAAWSRVLLFTAVGPFVLGSILLLPAIVRFTLLDVRPFAAVSTDPSIVLSHDTSILPFIEALNRFGPAGFLVLWFGVSCFYCSVPSKSILDGAAEQNHSRSRWPPFRIVLTLIIWFFRMLRGIDRLLLFGFAGSYLASGLLTLVFGWRIVAFLTFAWF